MKKKGRPGNNRPFTWGYIAVAFLAGLVFALLLWRYSGPGRGIVREEEAPELRPAKPTIGVEVRRPRVAIVIDDMGYDMRRFRSLLEVDAQITVAVLPHLRFSREVALEAYSNGWEVLLHLPMEPRDMASNDPGKGALLTAMGEGEVRLRMEEDLKGVPHASGVNNHMGSRFTEDPVLMRTVLDVVRDHKMFFLDSRTTSGSVAGTLAREMGVKGVERTVFLDNTRDEEYIKARLKELVSIARERGKAVAIGHPYPETIDALKSMVGAMQQDGIEVVRVSDLVE
jgi:polysaccharide deacetylase 2 family uncharacterized protein YibQ